jgi:Tfp pilus assembly protein PilX
MNPTNEKLQRESERGVALLIALFALLLISAMAAGLIVTSGTETSIDANYRTSTQAFFDARAGIEEARGRMWRGSPNSIAPQVTPTDKGPAATPSTLFPGNVFYIVNPSQGEVVAPNVAGSKYFDSEYSKEWNASITTANVTPINSIYAGAAAAAGLQGPLYKWVRITAATEASTNTDVNNDGIKDAVSPIFYDGKQQLLNPSQLNCPPLGVISNSACQAWQVFQITSLAETPTGSQRLLQYEVAPTYLNLRFPSALTFDGPSPVFNAPNSNPFMMNGNDRSGKNQTACDIPPQGGKPAIGDIRNGDTQQLTNAIPSNRQNHYTGCVSGDCTGTPAIGNVSSQLDTTQQTPAQLDDLVNLLMENATEIVSGPASTLPDYGDAQHPVIAVVTGANNGAGGTGDFTLGGSVTGYGILVVTGNLTFQGTAGWNGVVLVIGQGSVTESGGGTNEFDGAFFVAKTRDAAGNELNTLGTPTLDWSGGGGNGIYYDSCWINNAGQTALYKVLSFREIPQ